MSTITDRLDAIEAEQARQGQDVALVLAAVGTLAYQQHGAAGSGRVAQRWPALASVLARHEQALERRVA